MLDLELLNLWIHKLNFDIRNDRLYISLSAYSKDICNSYIMPLSSDRNKILDFFGFDTTRDYDHMTDYNQFEYLCSSTKLDPIFISYFSFKGPGPKNNVESKFEKYLVNKNYTKFNYNKDYPNLDNVQSNLIKEAIEYFNKKDEYAQYMDQIQLLDKVMSIKDKLNLNGTKIQYGKFSKFLILHGIYNILEWDDETLNTRWRIFKKENWSGLITIQNC